MKRFLLIILPMAIVFAGFLLESIPGFAQSQTRSRNNLDSGLLYQQEGAGKQFDAVTQPKPDADTKTQNAIRRNTISKSKKKDQ